jgi:hypothetical protein
VAAERLNCWNRKTDPVSASFALLVVAFQKIEQISVLFATAVANSRREIANGRRELAAAKLKLSGPEIQQRTAGYARSEQLINTAEREFATILEGLRL